MTGLNPKRILIVDDSPMVLEMVTVALEDAGYEVLCANDLKELEDHCQYNDPHLILMDVQMPEAFGDDVAMVLRLVRGIDVPIYLFSNLDEDELAERAADAECDGWISKRSGIEAMVNRVGSIVGPPGPGAGAP